MRHPVRLEIRGFFGASLYARRVRPNVASQLVVCCRNNYGAGDTYDVAVSVSSIVGTVGMLFTFDAPVASFVVKISDNAPFTGELFPAVRACVRACVRARARARVCECVRACVGACQLVIGLGVLSQVAST